MTRSWGKGSHSSRKSARKNMKHRVMRLGDKLLLRKRSWIETIHDHSMLKFFQFDITGMFRMTSSARYFKEGDGSSRPSWRWIMCFVERPKGKTSCRALVKCCRRLWGASDDTRSSMTSIRHSTCTFALRLPTVYAGRLFLSWASWAG